jgi:hypothetical protein
MRVSTIGITQEIILMMKVKVRMTQALLSIIGNISRGKVQARRVCHHLVAVLVDPRTTSSNKTHQL